MRGGVSPPPLIMPVKRRSASVIKMKSVTIKTPAITKGIIIDPSALVLSIKRLKGGEVGEKHPAGCFCRNFDVTQALLKASCQNASFKASMEPLGGAVCFLPPPHGELFELPIKPSDFPLSRFCRERTLIRRPLCVFAGFGTASTGWRSTSTTTWTSTVLTTRARRPTGAWSATSCSWSTTRATLPASTGCAASSAGSATVPAVPTDPCASQRSSSSSRPSPWASSSDPDTSTTTSVSSLFLLAMINL